MMKTLFDTQRRFDGAGYQPQRDNPRLSKQYDRIFNLMKDGQWRTLNAIEKTTGDPAASVSAQLRHMRKERFGGHTVERRHVRDGLHQYRLKINERPTH